MPEQTTEVIEQKQPVCDRGEAGQPPCGKAAVYAYQWDWGEKGICCAEHATLLQQVAQQIGRNVQLLPLQVAQPIGAPLQRDERTQLKARQLVLEEEIEEAKTRGLELYRINVAQQKEINVLTVREREARAQLDDREIKVQKLEAQLLERDAEHGELVAEVERLRNLEKLLDAPERAIVDG